MHIESIKELGKTIYTLLEKDSNNKETGTFSQVIQQAVNYNHWYTKEAVVMRLQAIAQILTNDEFCNALFESCKTKSTHHYIIGVHSEENIPLEEISTLLAILVSGNSFVYKTSEKSDKILPFLFDLLCSIEPEIVNHISFTDAPLKKVEKLIFTQKRKASVTTQSYLSKRPALLDVRHSSVAILNGKETDEELELLATDVFNYFGVGCGNVKKIYLPEGYPLPHLFEAFEPWHGIADHNQYANNYQYNQSVYLMNRIEHLDNGFLLLKQDENIYAPTGVLFYEFYSDENIALRKLNEINQFSYLYNSCPIGKNEKAFGSSVNQLLVPSEKIIQFLL
jgi:hypothetical protein